MSNKCSNKCNVQVGIVKKSTKISQIDIRHCYTATTSCMRLKWRAEGTNGVRLCVTDREHLRACVLVART